MDWAKESMGIKYSYLLELRPRVNRFSRFNYEAFFLKEDQLLPTAKETWEGIKIVADTVLQEEYTVFTQLSA